MLVGERRLSLGMLMHVKCTYVLCIILDYISSYLIVIYGHGHVLHCFCGFSKGSSLFSFQLCKIGTCFCVFLVSVTFWMSNGSNIFGTLFFQAKIPDENKNST
jgi:hypothetical protein